MKDKTTCRIAVDSLEGRTEGGRLSACLLSLTRARPFEPNDGFAEAAPLRSGDAVRANLTPVDDRDLFEVSAPSRGTLAVSVADVSSGEDIAVEAYFKAAKFGVNIDVRLFRQKPTRNNGWVLALRRSWRRMGQYGPWQGASAEEMNPQTRIRP